MALIARRSSTSTRAALLTCALLFALSTYTNAWADFSPDNLMFQIKKKEIFMQYGIVEAEPEAFEVKYISTPNFSAEGGVAWTDNHTFLYLEHKNIPALERKDPENRALISFDTDSEDGKQVLPTGTNTFCYDYENKNIWYVKAKSNADGIGILTYGKLGEPLLNYAAKARTRSKYPEKMKSPDWYLNRMDCHFYTQYPSWKKNGVTDLRTETGSISVDADRPNAEWGYQTLATYTVTLPTGDQKRVSLGSMNISSFKYDYFSQSYWHAETRPDNTWEAWWLDKSFNIVDHRKYKAGPWARPIFAYSTKAGFIVPSTIWVSRPPHEVVYLVKKDSSITYIPGVELVHSVAPDGCHVLVSMQRDFDDSQRKNGSLALLDVCRDFKEEILN